MRLTTYKKPKRTFLLVIQLMVIAIAPAVVLDALPVRTAADPPSTTNTAIIQVFNHWQCPPSNKLDVDTYPGPTSTPTAPVDLCDAQQASILDPYGFSNRDCGSYVAWMTTQENVQFAQKSVLGLPGRWSETIPANIPGAKIVSVPKAGDIAVRPPIAGITVHGEPDLGHAMYVVSGNWQYSLPGQQDLLIKNYSSQDGEFAYAAWSPTGDIIDDSGVAHPFHLIYFQLPPLTTPPAGDW